MTVTTSSGSMKRTLIPTWRKTLKSDRTEMLGSTLMVVWTQSILRTMSSRLYSVRKREFFSHIKVWATDVIVFSPQNMLQFCLLNISKIDGNVWPFGSFVNKICTLISFLTTFSYVLHYGPLEGSKDGKAKVLTYLDGMLALMLICTLYRCWPTWTTFLTTPGQSLTQRTPSHLWTRW